MMPEIAMWVTIMSRWTDNLTYQVPVQATTPERAVEEAFGLTNLDKRPHGNSVCATSVGDLLFVQGRYFVVEPVGCKEITAEQAIEWQKVDHRDAHMGFERCAREGLI